MAIKNLVRGHPESGWIGMTKETKMEKPDYLKIFKKAIFRILKKACKNQNRFSTYIPHFPFFGYVRSISCNSAAFFFFFLYTFKAPQPPHPHTMTFYFRITFHEFRPLSESMNNVVRFNGFISCRLSYFLITKGKNMTEIA